MTRTQTDLTQGIQAFQPEAQRKFVARYFEPIFRLLVVRFRIEGPDAEEIAYQILCEALVRPERYDEARGTMSTWLARIAVNRAIDFLRARRREKDALTLLLAERASDPESILRDCSSESMFVLKEAIEALPASVQEMLWWHAYGIPHRQIATWTGKSEAAIRQAVARAKRKLRSSVPAAPNHNAWSAAAGDDA